LLSSPASVIRHAASVDAFALALSDICAKVLLPDLAQDAGLRTLALIQRTGHEAVFLIADVSDHEQVQHYVKSVMDKVASFQIIRK
jgi:hypothetical protein